jgi:hypothetical protein
MSHLHPKDMGGAIVSVDQMIPPARWEWGGPDWQANVRTEVSLAIVGAELQGGDPDAMSSRWAAVLDRPRTARDGGFVIAMDDGGEVRFVQGSDGRGEGLGGFDLAVRDPAEVRRRAQARGLESIGDQLVLCGTRVRLTRA